MVSVERIVEYAFLESEKHASPERSTASKLPLDNWPQEGGVEMNDVSLSYTEKVATSEEELVLKHITVKIPPKCKVCYQK